MYRSLEGMERDAKSRRMAGSLAHDPACGQRGLRTAWQRDIVRNGGLVIFDRTENDEGQSGPATVPPGVVVQDDTGARAEKNRAMTVAITGRRGAIMAGAGTPPSEGWQEPCTAAVAALRSLAAEIPGTSTEKAERDRKPALLLEPGAQGPGSRHRQDAAVFFDRLPGANEFTGTFPFAVP